MHHIEDHLVAHMQLLTSAAAYTLYAKQKIDQLTQKVDRVANFATPTTRRSELVIRATASTIFPNC